jgi:hypothetical protein
MQKVVGSNPIIRFEERPACGPFCVTKGADVAPAPFTSFSFFVP